MAKKDKSNNGKGKGNNPVQPVDDTPPVDTPPLTGDGAGTTSASITGERVFVFEGPGGFTAVATISEAGGDLLVHLEVLEDGGDIGDLRGFFLDIGDESLLSGMSVSGDDITKVKIEANAVTDLGKGNNVNGEVANGTGPFDLGVSIGTQGIGKDDIRQTTFTITHDTVDLSLDLISGDLAVRTTSVGPAGGSREGSLKLTGEEEPDLLGS
ncbi:hypothetical protein, partial [Paralimibaculum aggregatum]|uniref:hypothetical protein n=1 Tax=Paralimibaculum aggregatum TaxID=3036245 RepID=UPI002555BCC6